MPRGRKRKLTELEESALLSDWARTRGPMLSRSWLYTQDDLASKFGVPRTTVQSILRRHGIAGQRRQR